MNDLRGRIVVLRHIGLTRCKPSGGNGDHNLKSLPAGLLYAGDLALVSEVSEADTADTVLTHISVGTAADLTSVVLTGGILLGLLLLEYHCCFSHSNYLRLFRKGSAHKLKELSCLVICRSSCYIPGNLKQLTNATS